MRREGISVVADTALIEAVPFPIPVATPGGVRATLINADGARGLVTTIIHVAAGARIPAPWHDDGAEAHHVLDGDLVNGPDTLGPGAFVTRPAGVVHGPRSSAGGCRILTLQTSFVDPAAPGFHSAE